MAKVGVRRWGGLFLRHAQKNFSRDCRRAALLCAGFAEDKWWFGLCSWQVQDYAPSTVPSFALSEFGMLGDPLRTGHSCT